MAVERQLNAGRKRRLLRALDAALAAQGRRQRPPAARAAAATVERRAHARAEAQSGRRSYAELRDAIRAQGGISPNADYRAGSIPRELRAPRGRGLAPDEMAQVLSSSGLHYEGDSELFADVHRRRDHARQVAATAARQGRHHNPSTVCAPTRRDAGGHFARAQHAVSAAVTYCVSRWRDAVGRFKAHR